MPSFKPKANKKIVFNKKSAVTLDSKHREFINEFSKDEHVRIPELKQEHLQLKELQASNNNWIFKIELKRLKKQSKNTRQKRRIIILIIQTSFLIILRTRKVFQQQQLVKIND